MNDGTNNSGTDTDNGTGVGEDVGTTSDIPEVPEDNTSDDTGIDSVSDTMGSNLEPTTDTEGVQEDIESDPVDNTETGLEVQENISAGSSEIGAASSIDYTYELNNIEYWQTQQLAEFQAVQSVSGNSIMITFDEDSMQVLMEVQEKQDALIDGQATFCGLLGCLVFAVCAEWLIGSAKRAIKHFTGRKD